MGEQCNYYCLFFASCSFQVTLLESRSAALEELCKARFEAGERSLALNQFLDKYNSVSVKIYLRCTLSYI